MLAVAAFGLLGCSDKLSDESNRFESNESYVYMNVAVALPSASTTRSATEDDPSGSGQDQTNSDENKNNHDDFEYGYDYENHVEQMLLVLASAEDNKYISHTLIGGIVPTPTTNQKYGFTVGNKFSRSEIVQAYKDGRIKEVEDAQGNKTYPVNVYVYCNPGLTLINKFDDNTISKADWFDWTEEVSDKDNAEIWENNHFLMSNALEKTAYFPKEEDWSYYTTEQSPFHLSTPEEPVYVERTAVRFDFKNESTTYAIKTPEGKNVVNVELTDMALVNMSKNYYYLRRVSANGTNSDWKVGQKEISTNYVVDTDYEMKRRIHEIDNANNTLTANQYYNTTNAETGFYFPLFVKTTDVNTPEKKQYNLTWNDDTKISTILRNGTPDKWEDGVHGYTIWRYLTENTIPGGIENQKTIQSTGIVFKAKITKGADFADANFSNNVSAALEGTTTPILYFYNNTLYAGIDELIQGAQDLGNTSSLYRALNEVLANWVLDGTVYKKNSGTPAASQTVLTVDEYLNIKTQESTNTIVDLDENDIEFKRLLTAEKVVTMYEADGNGEYYCYYFYWNRHNDNLNNSVMGCMEFATVRNNVYKLSVSSIGRLGHPTDPENDPDPVDPNDPDEDDDVYIDVTVEVLPWVVRVNDIKF